MDQARLIIIGGFAGAGKTTMARRLAKEFNLTFFCSDDFSEAIIKTTGKSFHESAMLGVDIYWFLIAKHLSSGISVLLDTNMHHSYSWGKLDEVKRKFPEVQTLPIILEGPLETHKQRIEERKVAEPEHLNLGGEKFEDVVFKYDLIQKLDRPDIIKIDATGSKEETYKRIEALLK